MVKDRAVSWQKLRADLQHEYLAIAENKFKDYSEAINSASKSSRMFSLFSQLSHEHFTLNGCKHRIVWNYPTVEIL